MSTSLPCDVICEHYTEQCDDYNRARNIDAESDGIAEVVVANKSPMLLLRDSLGPGTWVMMVTQPNSQVCLSLTGCYLSLNLVLTPCSVNVCSCITGISLKCGQ